MKKSLTILALLCAAAIGHAADALYKTEFSSTPLGLLPGGWRDLGVPHASPNWGVDGKGLLRVMWKGETGLLTYDGPMADGKSGGTFVDGTFSAEFQKTPEQEVFFGLVGRVQDAKNYYAARFIGTAQLDLIKVTDGNPEVLATLPTRARYQEGETWKLSMTFKDNIVTTQVFDAKGIEQARVDAQDEQPIASGPVGLQMPNYAGAKNFVLDSLTPFTATFTEAQIAEKNKSAIVVHDVVLPPTKDVEKLNTPYESLARAYDIVVAGAGTGGWAAAIQAARMGAKVLLLEETDWIGGQMSAAGVTSMDEEGVWEKFPVRQRGIYREFHQSIINTYYTANKDPFRAYYNWPVQMEGGYEPKLARAVLYAYIADERKKGTLDLSVSTKVAKVIKSGDTITGVEIDKNGQKKTVDCKVLIEATEYGDVLPLTGSRYRAGTTTSENLIPDSPVQADTYLGIIREYPDGLPEELKIKEAPPGYDPKSFKKSQLYGKLIWGGAGKDYKGPRTYRVLLAWRGMADIDSPATGKMSEGRHTQCGLNGGFQDYDMNVASLENMDARKAGQLDGIYRTLRFIYYLQNELGLPWGLTNDEGYDTPYNIKTKGELNIRPDLAPMTKYMPQTPYVRESRRGRGIYTLRTTDMGRFENNKLWPTSVAIVDYFMDIDHGSTGDQVEHDLDPGPPARGGGPVQVPFEVFIPEKIDGLVLAEKNISQSRIVNGATRLQPSTMLTGQAAGAIAAIAVKSGVQPRAVNPIAVQTALLQSGDNLVQRWYSDVEWGTELWEATQLLTMYSVMDEPGPFVKTPETGMGGDNTWRPDATLEPAVFAKAIAQLAQLAKVTAPGITTQNVTWQDVTKALQAIDPKWKPADTSGPVTRAAFALAAADVLRATGKPELMTDAKAPPVIPIPADQREPTKKELKQMQAKKKKEEAAKEKAKAQP